MSGSSVSSRLLCPWAAAAPQGLCDAAESWSITELPDVFTRAHSRFKSHDDGNGRCKVCGGPMDLEAWMDRQAEEDLA